MLALCLKICSVTAYRVWKKNFNIFMFFFDQCLFNLLLWSYFLMFFFVVDSEASIFT